MIWLFIAAAVVGLALGARFKVPALIAASIAAAAASLVACFLLTWSLLMSLLCATALVLTLQAAYLVSVSLWRLRSRREGRDCAPK